MAKQKPAARSPDLGPIEREFVAAIGEYVDWAIAESMSIGETSICAYLMEDSFWVERRSSRRANPIYWGTIAPPSRSKSGGYPHPVDQGQRTRAIAAIRKELNDLPPSLHLNSSSSIEIELFFERGQPKSAKTTRLRKA